MGHFGSFLGHFGNFGSFLGQFGQFWVIFGLFWVILGHFWPFFGANFLWQNMPLCYLNRSLQLWWHCYGSIVVLHHCTTLTFWPWWPFVLQMQFFYFRYSRSINCNGCYGRLEGFVMLMVFKGEGKSRSKMLETAIRLQNVNDMADISV